ncbi:MAG TPA: hypothetical protein VM900_10195 [Sphingomonas sp.]|nr:hypothetical protein [Sphingomonas sp.]
MPSDVARDPALPSATGCCYSPVMLKTRIRKKAADAERANRVLAEVVTSIEALQDEDLLDLADIFSGDPKTILGEFASAEMQRRNLSP